MSEILATVKIDQVSAAEEMKKLETRELQSKEKLGQKDKLSYEWLMKKFTLQKQYNQLLEREAQIKQRINSGDLNAINQLRSRLSLFGNKLAMAGVVGRSAAADRRAEKAGVPLSDSLLTQLGLSSIQGGAIGNKVLGTIQGDRLLAAEKLRQEMAHINRKREAFGTITLDDANKLRRAQRRLNKLEEPEEKSSQGLFGLGRKFTTGAMLYGAYRAGNYLMDRGAKQVNEGAAIGLGPEQYRHFERYGALNPYKAFRESFSGAAGLANPEMKGIMAKYGIDPKTQTTIDAFLKLADTLNKSADSADKMRDIVRIFGSTSNEAVVQFKSNIERLKEIQTPSPESIALAYAAEQKTKTTGDVGDWAQSQAGKIVHGMVTAKQDYPTLGVTSPYGPSFQKPAQNTEAQEKNLNSYQAFATRYLQNLGIGQKDKSAEFAQHEMEGIKGSFSMNRFQKMGLGVGGPAMMSVGTDELSILKAIKQNTAKTAEHTTSLK